MVQYNQYIDPVTDELISKIANYQKLKENKKHYSKTDVVLKILQDNVEKYVEEE